MKVTFQDYYGQYVTIHNETGSGNIRLEVRTTKSLNNIRNTLPENCEIVTDISLDEGRLSVLIGALKSMQEDI